MIQLFSKKSKLKCTARDRSGVTLTEILTVLVIVGILSVTFMRVFLSNWFSYDERITRANLWQESNSIVEAMTRSGRQALRFDVQQDSVTKAVTMMDRLNQPIVTYTMYDDGNFKSNRAGATNAVMSSALDFTNSAFVKDGESLRVNLALEDKVFTRTVEVNTTSEIYPRN